MSEYAPEPGRRSGGPQPGLVPFPVGDPLHPAEFARRFPRGFDLHGNGYLAAFHMADGRLWGLLPLALGRLRIVIIEDEWTAGEHWCYSDNVAAIASFAAGPDVEPTGWSRHTLPDYTHVYPPKEA